MLPSCAPMCTEPKNTAHNDTTMEGDDEDINTSAIIIPYIEILGPIT
jgi:hypothetical protein